MTAILLRRIVRLVIVCIGVSLVTFLLMHLSGDPVSMILPEATESVLFVNVRQVIDSEVVKKFALGQIKQALQGNDAKKMLYALPFLFFVILLMVAFGRQLVLIFVAIGAVNWLDMARIVRGQTLSLKRKEFVEAARISGASTARILSAYILPNLLGVVAVYATLTVPQVILIESLLSFLGLGVQPPDTSWGALVQEGAQEMEHAPWLLLFPASLLALTLLSFNFLGDGLRDALDPKDR